MNIKLEKIGKRSLSNFIERPEACAVFLRKLGKTLDRIVSVSADVRTGPQTATEKHYRLSRNVRSQISC